MTSIQKAFDQTLERLPFLAIQKIVTAKLASQGVEDADLARRIADALLASKGGPIQIDSPFDVSITFDEEDSRRLHEAVNAFLMKLPDLTQELVDTTAKEVVDELRRQWAEQPSLADEAAKLRVRIAKNWSGHLEELRLLTHLCAQDGERFNYAQLESKLRRRAACNTALARLHIRACRIANEILLLVENGHTEGAQARWRTLHEVAVTTTLLAEGGDQLAERYFAHEAIERKKALNDHRRVAEAAGMRGATRAQATSIEGDYNAVVRKYGRHFQSMYGWAGGSLGLPDAPQFHHLQEVAGSLSEKLRFRFASFDTHASPQTLNQPVHNWDPTTQISGNFSAGFERPIADTAQTIVQITILLFAEPWDLDQACHVKALVKLRDDLVDGAFRTAKRIERDERRSIERAMRGPRKPFGYHKRKPIQRGK